MRTGFFRILSVVIFSTFLTCCEKTGTDPGNLAPDFTLSTVGGQQMTLSGYRGRVVLLNLWATWCPPCLEEMPSLEKLHREFKDRGLVVLAIASRDNFEDVETIRQKLGLTFPLLVDEQGKTAVEYLATGFPETFIIDAGGRLLMFPDPSTGENVSRVTGPRDWSQARATKTLENILAESAH